MWALIASSVPAGVATGATNLTIPLISMQTAEEAGLSNRLLADRARADPELRPASDCTSLPIQRQEDRCGHTLELPRGYCCLYGFLPSWNCVWLQTFLRQDSLLFILAVTLCCFAFNDQARLTSGEIMARAGLMTCLLAAVYSVTLYTAGATTNDPKQIGPVLAASQVLMCYGALILIAASACGVRPEIDRDLLTRDWHLTEAYVFITLIVFPPQTLLELGRELFGG